MGIRELIFYFTKGMLSYFVSGSNILEIMSHFFKWKYNLLEFWKLQCKNSIFLVFAILILYNALREENF